MSPSHPNTSRLVGPLGLILGLALIGLNAWWAWADYAPVPEARTVDALISRSKTDEARVALETQVARSRHDYQARMKLARLLAKAEDYPGCARLLREVPEWAPNKAESLFIEAQSFKQVDRMRDAEAAWKQLTAGDPLHPVSPRYYQGAARELIGHYVLENRLDEARDLIMRSFDLGTVSERADIMIMRTRAELERIAHEEAVTRLRAYVAADPDDWQARTALAAEEQATDHPDAADALIQSVLAVRPEEPSVWRTYLEILQPRGNRDAIRDAIARLPKTEAIDNDPVLWKFRGQMLEWDNDLEGAAKALTKATDLNPSLPEPYYKLGLIEQRLGRTADAAKHLKRSRDLRKADTDLDDAFHKFVDISRDRPPTDPAYIAEVNKLADLCETLGWAREARAWRRVLE